MKYPHSNLERELEKRGRELIRIFPRAAEEKGVELTIIVDIIHVIEYLWDAGRAFHPKSGPELENWVRPLRRIG